MRTRFLLVLTCCLCLLMLSHQPLPAQEQRPKMVLTEREFDLKKVREGEILNHSFSIRNEGDAPLEIRSVKPG
jgi:hypothetical protein